MRAVIQRVSGARVMVDGRAVGQIGRGLVALVGIVADDGIEDQALMADKIANLRFFEDEAGKMNLSVLDVGGEALLVPNFTLAGATRKGRRPSFDAAMRPEQAVPVFIALCDAVRALGVPVQTGVFRATMQVELVNEGPVTLIVDTRE